MATWAFGNGNRFDLVALPRLVGVLLDETYLDSAVLSSEILVGWAPPTGLPRAEDGGRCPPYEEPSGRPNSERNRVWPIIAGAAVLAGVGIGLAVRRDRGEASPVSSPGPHRASATSDRPPPERSAYRDEPIDPSERARIAEALIDLAAQFEVTGATDPVAVMTVLAIRVRYRGPLLTAQERANLEAESGRGSATGRCAWDARVRRFADDRPLPADFAQGRSAGSSTRSPGRIHLDDTRRPAAIADRGPPRPGRGPGGRSPGQRQRPWPRATRPWSPTPPFWAGSRGADRVPHKNEENRQPPAGLGWCEDRREIDYNGNYDAHRDARESVSG